MRKTIHDRPISFRANGNLVDAATAKAHEAGMSLPEVLRGSLRSAASGNLEPKGNTND